MFGWLFGKKRQERISAFDRLMEEKSEVIGDIQHLREDIKLAVNQRKKKELSQAMDKDFEDTIKGNR